ncbi:hypothetical protein L915_20280 [Phytophthora nicotianae]|uniref:Uncharacterized protein n=2 Tax=Phytophthora nicotianae TaxID=4792 RepID=W2HWB8_PHYNI|nr:hypothetical protein L915_20280 [Phytophthora nicotianae]ETL26116.1 hypothetical protein L916_20148 [Phytophthora nicotianae]ETO61022.1 hypothetical protein F444_20887 [Phytophthora nicotianae P1976]
MRHSVLEKRQTRKFGGDKASKIIKAMFVANARVLEAL